MPLQIKGRRLRIHDTVRQMQRLVPWQMRGGR